MWKLIIAEDEPMVRRTIRNKVDWGRLGFEIVAEAENGEDALQLIREHEPDLVIADIVMPFMDGIELLKTARAEGRETRFLMLTCMNEFEYARQALEHGASAYVLKASMDMESLAEALRKIRRELESRTELLELKSRTKLYAYEQLLPQLWERLYAPANDAGLPASADAERGELVVRPVAGSEYVWIGVFLSSRPDRCLEEVERPGFSVAGPLAGLTAYCQSGVTTVFAFAGRPPKWNGPSALDRGGGASSTLLTGVNGRAVPVAELPHAWARLLQAADRLWYDNRVGVIYEDLQGQPKAAPPQLSWVYEKELLREFEQAKLEACTKTLEAMWEEQRRLLYPLVLVKSAALHLDQVLARIAGRPAIPARELLEAASFADMKARFERRLSLYMHHYATSEGSPTDHEEINKIIAYIRQNYDAPLTLKSLSRYVSMEEHYVSRLFKKKVGESLIHYLQQYRVEKAKALLTETDLSIGDVGRSVGFANDNYFNKIFKRTTGLTPSEFRKRFQPDKIVP
ncbi:helix-turn-helix domain-containing protein [Paenibacillus flagellatus]|uniref:DNA-binding response regulator n=1 Tax=Paenibacillus flagellatus TaxID=2211139 RepID=A0A2V5KSM0_9BACL|nr:helix-turn-helix domain-containing protein [Paenibacillus flagellatus]PYI52036.1 hypothetical protein DLM86_21350 [Paenibacillus flagellatus]